MAMNKKELGIVEELKTKLALHFYPETEPDIDPPTESGVILNGYTYNAYSYKVEIACTSRVSRGIGYHNKTNQQNPMKLYSTEKKAYEGLLCAMAKSFARTLRVVEKHMEEISDND